MPATRVVSTLALLGIIGGAQLAGCREVKDNGAKPRADALGGSASGAVARVGPVSITPAEVRGVMAARGLDARTALDALVRDSALASEISPEEKSRAKTRALARAALEELRQQTQAPPSEAEVAEFTRRHWLEFDRPESSRITHAVVVCDECPDPAAARALAERIAAATAGKNNPEQFKAAAAGVPVGDQKVAIEDLDPVAADGRTVDLERRGRSDQDAGTFHLEFAQAAARLAHVGEQSPVVRSPSGFHVLLLTERLPALRVPFDERAKALTPEIQSARAKALQEETLKQARARWPVEVLRSVAQDTELVLPRP